MIWRQRGNAGAACASVLGASVLVVACGTTKPPPPPPPLTTSSSSSSGVGGDVSAPSSSGVGGNGGGVGGGGAPPAGCGDGAIVFPEQCDGKDLGGAGCKDIGYDDGVLTCGASCQYDESKCTRKEDCTDGLDNDKDGQTDCADGDCAAACAASCTPASLQAISTAFFVGTGDTTGHAGTLDASCSSKGGTASGPEIVYQTTAELTGVLDVELTSDENLGVSARAACATQASELGCADAVSGPHAVEHLKIAVTKGEAVFLVVQGYTPLDAGAFTLSVKNRAVVCGDGATDGAEQCDDGATAPGDGCDAQCHVESTEVEPNDTAASANASAQPWFGTIAPAGDVDVIKVVVAKAPATLTATIGDFDGACQAGTLDSYLEVLDKDGATLLTTDDDGGVGACSSAQAVSLAVGTYFVRVSASPKAASATFAYKLALAISSDVCGDGVVTGGEQCDDGNLAAGDGCGATCQLEPTESEPNGASATANKYAAKWRAQIAPVGDVDYVAIDVPASATSLTAAVVDDGTGACAGLTIVSHVDILGVNGSTVLASGNGAGGNYCAAATATALTAGKYFVRIKASNLAQPGVSDTFGYGLDVTVQ